MAREVVVAVKSGNWSDPTVWNTGRLPESTDQVFANGFTVTIDQDVTVRAIMNDSTPLTECPIMVTETQTKYDDEQGEVLYDPNNQFVGLIGNEFYEGTSTTELWPRCAFDDYLASYGSYRAIGFNLGYAYINVNRFIGYDFKEAIKINNIDFFSGLRVQNFDVDAWDGTSWITLYNWTGNTTNVYAQFTNDIAYEKYRIFFRSVDQSRAQIPYINMWYSQHVGTIATGTGGFVINSDETLTITTTDRNYGFVKKNENNSADTITKYGTGTLNLYGNFAAWNQSSRSYLNHAGGGSLNITGNMINGSGNTRTVSYMIKATDNPSAINMVGDLTMTAGQTGAVYVAGSSVLNLTGDIFTDYGGSFESSVPFIYIVNGVEANIVGDVFRGRNTDSNRDFGSVIRCTGLNTNVYHTGTITCDDYYLNQVSAIDQVNGWDDNMNIGVQIDNRAYYNQVGSLINYGYISVCIYNPVPNCRIILTGPFISSQYGSLPFYARRFFIRPEATIYQFRSNQYDGITNPTYNDPTEQIASPYTLTSYDIICDLPEAENVREGISYGDANYTGTLKVPNPNLVSYGVPTDNTVGTAILTGDDVWNVQTSAMNTEGSIGKRLKNASTVDSTGDQLTSLL